MCKAPIVKKNWPFSGNSSFSLNFRCIRALLSYFFAQIHCHFFQFIRYIKREKCVIWHSQTLRLAAFASIEQMPSISHWMQAFLRRTRVFCEYVLPKDTNPKRKQCKLESFLTKHAFVIMYTIQWSIDCKFIYENWKEWVDDVRFFVLFHIQRNIHIFSRLPTQNNIKRLLHYLVSINHLKSDTWTGHVKRSNNLFTIKCFSNCYFVNLQYSILHILGLHEWL